MWGFLIAGGILFAGGVFGLAYGADGDAPVFRLVAGVGCGLLIAGGLAVLI